MPAYHVAAVAFAAECEPKWIDNLLSHRQVRGVTGGQQGVARRITAEGALQIALARILIVALGLTIDRAVDLADHITERSPESLELGRGVLMVVDTERIRSVVYSRLTEALEVAVSPRRGRPRRNLDSAHAQ